MRNYFEQFVRDRRYLKGVSDQTVDWYWQSWKAYARVLDGRNPDQITKGDFLDRIEEMRRSKVSATTINTYSRAVNAFLRWLREEGHTSAEVKIPHLKEVQKVIATLTSAQIERLLAYRPTHLNNARAWTVAMLALDCGLRLNEALSLQRSDLDFDNLLIHIRDGKGGKERVVPISLAMRKVLYKYNQKHTSITGLVFYAGDGLPLNQNNIRRDFKAICAALGITGIKGGYHVLRHTFAVNYLRNGGNVFYLQRILGHSTLEMTNLYVRSLGVEDLQAVHQRLSVVGSGARV
jgi:site-specific recombinase XerD